MSQDSEQVTRLLEQLRAGDQTAQSKLAELMYHELRRLAVQHLAGENSGNSLRPSDLVQEAFLQWLRRENKTWEDRKHFIRSAALTMKHVLIDHGRKRQTDKRRHTRDAEPLNEEIQLSPIPGLTATLALTPDQLDELIPLYGALEELEREHPRPAEVIQLRLFADQSDEEIAHILGLNVRTICRDAAFAKAYLKRKLIAKEKAESER
jgi:RNA polymerase sigma-70 factor (ECF subfamily)